MPKVHFCKQIIEGKVCGENNPENFPFGRYGSCKKCRNRIAQEVIKNKKELEQAEIDPDQYTRYLIEDTIKKVPLIEEKSIHDHITSINKITICNSNDIMILKENNTLMLKYIKTLEEKIEALQRLH